MHDSSSRNPGLDLARNLAVFLVIVQHVVFLGGLSNDGMSSFHKVQARGLEALSQGCVDLFGLLSGYLGVSAVAWKWKKFARLWFQVWMTGLLVLEACLLIGFLWPNAFAGQYPAAADWITAACPLVRDEYWYFTGYLFVFLIAPIVNRHLFAEGLERRGFITAGLLFAVVCGTTVFPNGVTWLPLAKGYSGLWLVCLYIFGAALRRMQERRGCYRAEWYFLFAAFCVLVTMLQRFAMASVPSLKAAFADEWTLAHYTSPTVTLTAMALLLGCANLPPSFFSKRVTRFNATLARCAFGVYLIHVQPFLFRETFINGFDFLDRVPDGLFALAVLATAAALHLFLAALEGLRQLYWIGKFRSGQHTPPAACVR